MKDMHPFSEETTSLDSSMYHLFWALLNFLMPQCRAQVQSVISL